MVQVGITLAVLGRRELQELNVKASCPRLSKLEVQSGWTLPRREAQGSTQIILFCRKRLKVGDHYISSRHNRGEGVVSGDNDVAVTST